MWDWLFQFIGPLERAGIPYAIVGSVASSVYGEPRITNDVDVLLQLAREDAPKLAGAFPAGGFYVPPPEVIEAELARAHGGHLNILALETMAKADFYPLSADEAAWFARRRILEVDGRSLWFAAPEAVILHKLRFFREGGSEKHLRDIRGILAVSGAEIDRPALLADISRHGVADAWSRVQRE
ncbi:MAG: hypothetical protein JNG82_11620 [Opitutaceae bacterium]|nr:hypothetical protein [Opitutaceae bacterium]